MFRNEEFYNAVEKLVIRCLPLIDSAIKNSLFPKNIDNYPNLEYAESGFPRISSYPSRIDISQFFKSPYSGKDPDINMEKMEEFLQAFTIANKSDEIRGYYEYNTELDKDSIQNLIQILLGGAIKDFVERYYYKHGCDFHRDCFVEIYKPIETYFYEKKLNFDISIPILFVNFEIDYFELLPNIVIRRIEDEVHRARHRIVSYSPAIVDSLFMSATHELLLKNYEYNRPDHVFAIPFSQPGIYPRNHIEKFLSVLKIETDITSGYAQFILHPFNWAADYLYDIKPMHGTSVRSYPTYFDDYFWNRKMYPVVNQDQLINIGKSFTTILQSNNNKLNLAIKRFYKSTLREEEEDMIIDLIIALELLLGDSGKTEMTQKLAYRIGALLGNYSPVFNDSHLVFTNVKKIYDYRSSIIHGNNKTNSKREIKLPENKSIVIVDLA